MDTFCIPGPQQATSYEENQNFVHSGLRAYFDTLLLAMRMQSPATFMVPREMNAKGYEALAQFLQGRKTDVLNFLTGALWCLVSNGEINVCLSFDCARRVLWS